MFFDREKSRSPKIQLIQTFAKRLGLLNLDISIRVIPCNGEEEIS